ncbi:MAG: hypothetical protein GWO22_16270, partial [Actinobacteria bacterium]|nr:hypothetical protein [Actinomycetota bacterium]
MEGLLVGAVTTGANRAWIYVRAEYPDAIERLRHAVGGFEAAGLADGIETEVRV